MFDYINQGLLDAADKKASTAHNALQLADSHITKLEQAAYLALDALRALQDNDDGSLVSPARNWLSLALGEDDK